MNQSLNFKIGADTRLFMRGLAQVKSSAASAAKTVSGMVGAFAGVGGALSAAGFAAFTKQVINLGDNIGKASKRIGVSAEAFQKLSFASSRSGASMETLESGLRKMQSTIYDAGQGMETSVRALGELGLSFQMLDGMNPEKQFEMIGAELIKIEDATKRAAIAQDIFGRSGTMLLPMIADYGTLKKEIEDIGGIMSDEAIAAAENFNDQIENLTASLQGLVANSGLLTWLSDVANALNNASQLIKDGFGGAGLDKAIQEGVTGSIAESTLLGEIGDVITKGSFSPVKWASDFGDWMAGGALPEREGGEEVLSIAAPGRAGVEKARAERIAKQEAEAKKQALIAETKAKIEAEKRQKIEEQITKEVEKQTQKRDRLQEQLEKAIADAKFEAEIDLKTEELDKAEKILDKMKDDLDVLKRGLSEFGITDITKPVSEQLRGGMSQEELTRRRIGFKLRTGRGLTGEEQGTLEGLERQRQQALNMQQAIDAESKRIAAGREQIGEKQQIRAKAERQANIEQLQKQLGLAKGEAAQVDAIRKGNEPLEDKLEAIRSLLAGEQKPGNQDAGNGGAAPGGMPDGAKKMVEEAQDRDKARAAALAGADKMIAEARARDEARKAPVRKTFRPSGLGFGGMVAATGGGARGGLGKSGFSDLAKETDAGLWSTGTTVKADKAAGLDEKKKGAIAAAGDREQSRIFQQQSLVALQSMREILDKRLPEVK